MGADALVPLNVGSTKQNRGSADGKVRAAINFSGIWCFWVV